MSHGIPAWLGVIILLGASTAGAQLPGIKDISPNPRVVVTWYGVSTLLFDDGDTKVLIDGFFSRPQFENLESMASPDMAQIRRMIDVARLDTLAAITPVHSHFDHAMDLGVIAKLTGATVLGSESTANIARGAGVAESQIRVVRQSGQYRFGGFTVQLIRSAHAPLVDGGPPIPGTIDRPITPPVPVGAWKEGGSYSVVIGHAAGTALVQGSAGFVKGALDQVEADVVFLGIGGLGGLGKSHASAYFRETVTAVGAGCVVPVHWDNFMLPFGRIEASGDDDAVTWLRALPVRRATMAFAEPVDLYRTECATGAPPAND